jgi:hypothetical protein
MTKNPSRVFHLACRYLRIVEKKLFVFLHPKPMIIPIRNDQKFFARS